jgi:hypothetical protein
MKKQSKKVKKQKTNIRVIPVLIGILICKRSDIFIRRFEDGIFRLENIIKCTYPITEVQQHWVWLVLVWVTVWEHHLPLTYHSGREADHSPPSSAEVKGWVELYLHSPNTPSWRGVQLGGAQGQLYLPMKIYVNRQNPWVDKGKGKAKLSLCLTTYHVVKTYGEWRYSSMQS